MSGTTRRGRTVDSTQRTEGNQRTTDTTITGRSGASVTGSREVTRDGDTLKIEREAQSSTGAWFKAERRFTLEKALSVPFAVTVASAE